MTSMYSQEPTAEELARRAEIRAQYPYLVTREEWGKKISGVALASKNIKRLLAHEFPGVKFSTDSDTYAGGCSITVSWTLLPKAPTHKQVDALIDANFSYARFDGMTDSTEYDRDPWRQSFRALFGSAGYVHSQPLTPNPEEIAKLENQQLERDTPQVAARKPRGPRL